MKVGDVLQLRMGGENAMDAALLENCNVVLGNRAPEKNQDIVQFPLPNPLHQLPGALYMGTRKDAHADDVHRLLERDLHDLLHTLAQARIDHFHPLIPQPIDQHLGPHVMAVQADLGNEYTIVFFVP